jgi:hypothetical protein
MQYTDTHLDEVESGIATIEGTARTSDGRTVVYRPVAELKEAAAFINTKIIQQKGPICRVIKMRYTGF